VKDEAGGVRRYSEEEFALILRKASEIQDPPGGGSRRSRGHGLTLEEIQSIAREAGIDPQAVSRAAALLGSAEWGEKGGLAGRIFGGPGTYHLSFQVPGRLPPEEYRAILELIRRTLEHQGEVAEVLGGVEWKTVGEVSAINVNISPHGGSTSIQIVGDRGAAGALTFIFPILFARTLFVTQGKKFRRRLARLMDALSGAVEAAALPPGDGPDPGSSREED
jgi:DNA-binding transcriptional MerR regulator